jgi:hypothetical protein
VKFANEYLEPLPDVLVERKVKDEEWTEERNIRGLKCILPNTNAACISEPSDLSFLSQIHGITGNFPLPTKERNKSCGLQ